MILIERSARALAVGAMIAVGVALGADAQTLHRGNAAEPQTLDPQKATGVPESNILRDVYENLIAHGPDASNRPGAAERWEISKDGLTYTFHLRANGRWSNGDPVTAEDFLFGFRRAVDPATASRFAWLLKPIKNADAVTKGQMKPEELGAEAVNATTFRLTLESPTPFMLELVKHAVMAPIHRKSYAEHGDRFTRPGNLVTNGPFQLVEWRPQAHLKLARNPQYWDAANVKLAEIMYYPTEDRAAELARFRAGELHITYEVPVDQVPWIKQNMAKEFRNALWFGTYYLTLNNTRPPYNDSRVRRALALTIDRDAIVEKITQSGERPAYAWVPPGASEYRLQKADFADMPMAARIAEAKKLVADAGFGPSNPLKIEFLFNTADEHRRIGIALASMWQEALGAQTELRNVEWQVYLDSTARAQYGQARAGWIGATHGDASYFLEKFKGDAGEANTARWKNAEYDSLLEKAAKEPDPEKRVAMMEQAEQIMLKDLPIIPLYHYSTRRMVSTKVAGVVDNPRNVIPSKYLSLN